MATQGLFNLLGPTPEEVRAQYEAGLSLTPAQMGQQGLLQQITSTIAGGGAGIGYGLGRMMGGAAPGEAEAIAQQEVLRQAQQSGLSGSALYKRLAETTADPRRALAFGQMAEQAAAAEAEAAQQKQIRGYQLSDAERKQNLQNALNAIPYDATPTEQTELYRQAIRQFGSVEQQTALRKEDLDLAKEQREISNRATALTFAGFEPTQASIYASDKELTSKLINERLKSPNLTFKEVVKEDGVNYVVGFDPRTGKEVKVVGKAPEKPGTVVDVGSAMTKVLAKAQGDVYKEGWQAAGNSYNTAIRDLPRIQELRASIPQSFTGAGADFRLTLAKAGRLVGIPVDEQQLSNTEYRNSFVSQLTQAIAKNYPGALSNKELDQLLKSLPASSQEPETIDKLLGLLQAELTTQKITYEKMAAVPMEKRSPEALNLEYGKHYSKVRKYFLTSNKIAQEIEAAKAKGDDSWKKKYLPKLKELQAIQQEYGL